MKCENDILNKNLKALKDRGWEITPMESSILNHYNISIVDSKEGVPTLIIEKEGKQNYIHSKYKPIEEAKRLTEKINKDTANIIVFGLGLGYHIREILQKTSIDARILIIIPDYYVFSNLLNSTDYSDIITDKRVCLHIYENKLTTKVIIEKYLNWKKINSIEFLYITNYQNIFSQVLKNTIEASRETISSTQINEDTRAYFSEDWQKNYFKNMPVIFQSTPITYFKNEFKNIPAVIVSAGPSLNKNVHLLKGMEENILILSTDSALKVLLKNNIKPHLVFTIDGDVLTYEKFRGIDYSHIPMVFHPLANDKIVEEHKGQKVFFTRGDHIFNLYMEKDLDTSLATGGSVATAAFFMACRMDANPVVFIGQDLAFTEERTHAAGTMYDEELHEKNLRKRLEKHYVKVKGNYEKEVITDPTYRSYLIWFQDAIAAEKNNRKFINATEGGAFIEGTEIMTLGEVCQSYCSEKYSIEEKIQSILSKGNPFTTNELLKVLEEHKIARQELVNIKKKAKLACKYVAEIKSIYEKNKIYSKSIQQTIKKLDKMDQYIKKQEKSTVFIEHIIQRNIIESDFALFRMEKHNETEQEKGLRIMKGNEVLYNGILYSIEKVEGLMDEYLNKMKIILGGEPNGN